MGDRPILEHIENKLAELRQEWVARPDKRRIIALQAKALQRAKEIAETKQRAVLQDATLYEQAKEIFNQSQD
ncbi:MAG: hypothetical protein H5T69_10350 [Chloroflexi bacterium]|nr:hypothetical protein [Chloroflexota bacterium]